jgi:hypothetical protein
LRSFIWRDCGNQRLQEARRRGSIDDAVVERQAQRQLRPRDDLPVVEHDWFASDGAQTQNRRFGSVDDRREGVDAVGAEIRDGEDGSLHVGYCQRSRPCPLDQTARLRGHLDQRCASHVLQNRHQQPLVGVHGHSHMQFLVGREHDRVLVQACGQQPVPLEHFGDDLDDDVLIARNERRTPHGFVPFA